MTRTLPVTTAAAAQGGSGVAFEPGGRAVAVREHPAEHRRRVPGRFPDERHFDRLTRLLDSGHAAVGGEHDRSDLFIAPTVLTDVDPASPVMQEEIFGPVLAVVEVDDLDAAIAFINERDKPLALYAFTSSEAIKSRLLNETSSGGVAWGQPVMQLLMPGLPFGGAGGSGMGRYHGRYSLETFSHLRAVADVPLS